MLNKFNLVTLNGSISGDHPGEFTFMARAKISTIDSMLVTKNLLLYVENFNVLPYFDSDHLPLSLNLKPPSRQVQLEAQFTPYIFSAGQATCWVKWSLQLDEKLKKMLAEDNMQNC